MNRQVCHNHNCNAKPNSLPPGGGLGWGRKKLSTPLPPSSFFLIKRKHIPKPFFGFGTYKSGMAYLGRSVDQSFFFGATPEIKERAKALRKRMTCCEKVLWQVLRKNWQGRAAGAVAPTPTLPQGGGSKVWALIC